MIISTTLMGAALMLQRDPAEAPREAFAQCLREFVTSSLNARKATDAFNTELATQCTTQEAAYREAMIRRDTAGRGNQASSRADAERDANDEISYSREQSSQSFADASAPQS